ncbi:MAG: fatty acid desaturase [Oligoflexia bacterium]|nr:fatty acid desaturase [Oligoflexia bacterium]
MSNTNANKRVYQGVDITPPEKLNLFIAVTAIATALFLLYATAHFEPWWIKAICIFMFSFIGNTIFGLLHEAVHSSFHNNRYVNYIFGNIFAAFFPTAFTFQKRCHLNHHRQNRTDFEMFEAYHDNDSKVLKTIMLYCILTGVYWTNPGIGALWLMIHPSSLINGMFSGKTSYKVGRMGGAGMLRHLEGLPQSEMTKMRLEALFSLCFQIGIFYFLGLTWWAWLLCYAAFAFQWSGLQYSDHAYTARDIRNGAWNLKVSKWTQYFFLNYHHHLAHHQHPHVSWIYLGKFIDPNVYRPTYWEIYFRMWKGLTKVEQTPPKPMEPEFEALINSEDFSN